MVTVVSSPALADTSDVETALLRPLTDNEQTYVPGLIDQASQLLRAAMPSVDARLAASDGTALDPLAVAAVVAGVVKRYMVNPTGAASTSEGMGPFSQTVSFTSYGKSAGGTTGTLAITRDDLAALAPSGGFVMPGTILTRPRHEHRGCHW